MRTVESCDAIDMREWRRRGMLVEGGFRWDDVWVTVSSSLVTFHYDGLRVLVAMEKTACTFGSVQQHWFQCPERGCSRRVAILYRARGRFACRHCLHLNYQTQHECAFDRALTKAQRIRMKLGGSANMLEPFPDKPTHMRWATYYRLCEADAVGAMTWVRGLRTRLACS